MSLRQLPILAVISALLLPFLPACGGSGGQSGKPRNKDLAVTYFSMDGRTDVERNRILEIRFTAPVKKSSVSNRTVRVLTGPKLQTPAVGALIVDGNVIRFDPTRTQESYDRDGLVVVPDHPFGFDALANYQVFIPAPPDGKTLLNRAGKPIVKSFFASFTTSEEYLKELDPPEFIGIDGTNKLGFSPDLKFDETQGEFVVPYNAAILIQFDEPIDPATMEPGATVLIKNQDVLDYLGRPTDIPGTFKPSKDGRLYSFVPSFHYGRGPYRISVELTQGIKDLAGNPLANPKTLYFRTEYKPDVNTIGVMTESFDTNQFEDVANTTAEWNTVKEGELQGGAITTTTLIVSYTPDGINSRKTRVDYPLISKSGNSTCPAWPNGVHVQASYKQEDIGGEGAISELAWGPDSNALFAAVHPNIQIRLGHTKDTAGVLGTNFANNFKDGTPLPNYDGEYGIPQRADIDPSHPQGGYWPFPKLTTPFDYNGKNGLLVDWRVDGANDCQLLRVWFWGTPLAGPGVRQILANTKDGAVDTQVGGQPLVYDMKFTKRRRITKAQSKFYDTAQAQPNYGEPIISPVSQPGGASFTLEWQGADGMPDPVFPGRVIPDPSTYTPWSTSIDTASRKRFVRFRVTLFANLNSDTVPVIRQIQIPYEF